MITLEVDEAYAFDFLSILKLKSDLDQDNQDKLINYMRCKTHIRGQIDFVIFDKILESREYNELYNINKETFDAVDKAKEDKVTASHVDQCNYRRYLAKVHLQNRFFPEDVTEKKVGY